MDWIAACDALDHHLHASGVPDDLRMKAMAQIMTSLARMGMEVRARQYEAQAAALLHTGAAAIAERQGCHRTTVYRRASRCRTKNTQRDKTG